MLGVCRGGPESAPAAGDPPGSTGTPLGGGNQLTLSARVVTARLWVRLYATEGRFPPLRAGGNDPRSRTALTHTVPSITDCRKAFHSRSV